MNKGILDVFHYVGDESSYNKLSSARHTYGKVIWNVSTKVLELQMRNNEFLSFIIVSEKMDPIKEE